MTAAHGRGLPALSEPNLEQYVPIVTRRQRRRSLSTPLTASSQNIEYARTLLFRLEHESADVKVQSRKQSLQADIRAKRDLIKRLGQRLFELGQAEDSSDEVTGSEDGEDVRDLLPSYGPARSDASAGLDVRHNSLEDAARDLTSTLRSRRSEHLPQAAEHGEATSSSLFPSSQQRDGTRSGTSESKLSANRSEQEALTTSLLTMAQALKSQSQQFGASLETDKSVLDKATEGLGKSSTNMDAASQRMGTLRRMTEGRGWWGRMIMYAWIAGLWIVAFLIVFALPKLRF